MADELVTPTAAALRPLFATNPSGGAGAPIVLRQGIADANGNQIGHQGDKPLFVATPCPAALVAGQVKIATTGTAVQLPSAALVNGIVVKAGPSNAAQNQAGNYTGAVGGASINTKFDASTGTGYPLAPGEAMSFAVANASALYVNGTAGDVFSFGGN